MNYNEDNLSTNFDVLNKSTGEVLGGLEVKEIKKTYRTAPGYRRLYMQKDGVYEKFMKSLSSGLEIAISVDFMRDMNKDGILQSNQAMYAETHDTTRSTVGKVFIKAKKFGLFKSAGRDVYVNPHVVLPYNSSDTNNYILQQTWDKIWEVSNANNGKITKDLADNIRLEVKETILSKV